MLRETPWLKEKKSLRISELISEGKRDKNNTDQSCFVMVVLKDMLYDPEICTHRNTGCRFSLSVSPNWPGGEGTVGRGGY